VAGCSGRANSHRTDLHDVSPGPVFLIPAREECEWESGAVDGGDWQAMSPMSDELQFVVAI